MSPILDTLFLIVLGAAVAVALLALLFRQPLGRARRYLHAWQCQDEQARLDAERDAALRERAEAELHRDLHGPDPAADPYDLNELKRSS